MAERSLNILQVSTSDVGGGAENVSWNLFKAYRARQHGSWLAVGSKRSDDKNVLVIPNHDCRGNWTRLWYKIIDSLFSSFSDDKKTDKLRLLLQHIGEPRQRLRIWKGREDFDFPGTKRLLSLQSGPPDIVHCHNLHGGYFDLRLLPWLSKQTPVVLTLHDAWLLSGHCAHSFDCEQWKKGCGMCPDLTIYPRIRRDSTAYNWRRKQEIYAESLIYAATPCRWLMQKVEQSMLAPAISETRVIPNGVDLSIFQPAEQRTARDTLRIPQDAAVLLFAAKGIRQSQWRDYHTMRDAVGLVSKKLRGRRLLFIALGDEGPEERIGEAEVLFVPFQRNLQTIARYYQAADLYLHAAFVDTFPNAILEALACGTPVVATRAGGIPEQVHNNETGFVTPLGDPLAMALRIETLLTNNAARRSMGHRAIEISREHFDMTRQADAYLDWYKEIIERHRDSCNRK